MLSPRHRCILACALGLAIPWPLFAQLGPSNVLVVYNSTSAASTAVKDHYAAARPGVELFDLNDGTIPAAQVSYTEFKNKIRNPIRSHLVSNNLLGSIYVIVLTKDIPHRISDINTANIGDNPGAVLIPNYTAASVDSELTLLYQDLDSGEANADEDSQADSYVSNPYYLETGSITAFGRSDIANPLEFRIQTDIYNVRHWQPGRRPFIQFIPEDASRIYLVARLDGNTVDDVKAMIDRAQHPVYDTSRNAAIFDRDGVATFDNGDFAAAAALLSGWTNVRNDVSTNFVIGRTGSIAQTNVIRESKLVAILASYGRNHIPFTSTYFGYENTFADQLVDGAIFNTFESYNGRAFGGLGTNENHGQISKWIENGGTFGVGNVWEPFVLGIVRNEEIVRSFVEGSLTWVEASYAGMRTLSWQGVVVGDPLAKAVRTTSAFAQWQYRNFGSTTTPDALAMADPDLDLRNNLLEYALGTDPNRGDPAERVTGGRIEGGGTTTIFFEVVVDTCRDDVTVDFEGGTDLVNWSPLTSTVVSTTLNLQTIRFETTLDSNARYFTRLAATLQ